MSDPYAIYGCVFCGQNIEAQLYVELPDGCSAHEKCQSAATYEQTRPHLATRKSNPSNTLSTPKPSSPGSIPNATCISRRPGNFSILVMRSKQVKESKAGLLTKDR